MASVAMEYHIQQFGETDSNGTNTFQCKTVQKVLGHYVLVHA